MRLIGITGGVGAGKSTVLAHIAKCCKCRIELADEVAHIVKEPGRECYYELVALLGEDILNEDGTIHKAKMAEKIFSSEDLLMKVNACIHPAVKKYLLEEIEKERIKGEIDFFFIEAALLLECGYKELVDEMWYIYAKESDRINRLKASRGYSDEKIAGIMSNQLSEDEFRAGCDFVIDNSKAFEEVYKQIEDKLKEYEG